MALPRVDEIHRHTGCCRGGTRDENTTNNGSSRHVDCHGEARFTVWVRRIANRRGILVPSLVADKRVEGEADHAEDEESLLAGALTASRIDEVEGNGHLPELEGVIK